MISTPRRRVHVYTEKENETPKVFNNTAKNHDGFSNHHRTPLANVNEQNLAVRHKDQIARCLIKESLGESLQTPGESKGRRSLNLDSLKQSLDQPKHTDREGKEDEILYKAKNILTIQDHHPAGPSLDQNITESEPGQSVTSSGDINAAVFNLISSSVEPIHCTSSSVISLTSINSEEFLEESQEHDESFLVEEFVGGVIEKAQSILLAELGSATAIHESSQAEKQPNCSQYSERDDIDELLAEEEQSQFNSEDQSFMPSYFEESSNNEEDFLELVSIRSSPALEEVLECSRDEKLLAYEDSCLSQCLDDGSRISLQNSIQAHQEFTDCENEACTNAFLQLTPSKILSSAPQIVPVFEHVVFPKSEYEVALCSGNLWHSKTKLNGVVTVPVSYMEHGNLTLPSSVSGDKDVVTETDRLRELHNIDGIHDNILTAPGIIQTNRSCGTSPLSLTNHSQMTTPIKGVSEGTCMTPTCLHTHSCNTSPVKVADQSTVMSPLEVKYQSCNTSPIERLSKETETVQLSTQDTAVGESVVTTSEGSTQMTPLQSHDKESGTSPVVLCNVSQMTTPVSSENAETCTTPISTSPLRLSSFSRKSENSLALMDQMKSSYISNKLLRREVSSLKKHRTLWEEHLQKEQLEMKKKLSMIKHKETEIHQARQAAKEAVQSEVEDLLSQVGQQLTQIGELEHCVQQKDEEIANLTRTNEERKKKYCEEVKELQDDLCLAYKQHEIEVTELKDKLEKQTSYEKLYHKSVEKNRRLEEEVRAFTELKESLKKASELQKKMSVMSETFATIKTLFQQTLAEKSALSKKQKELDKKEDELDKQFQRSSEETQHLMREMERLQEVAEEEKKKSILVEAERERLQDQLVSSQEENKSLQKSLKESLKEIEMLKSDGEGLQNEIAKLKDAEVLATANQQEREGELAEEISDARNANTKMKELIDELNETKERLSNELETLKTKYTEAAQREEALKVQLKNEEESKEFLQTEFESMEEYAKELEAKIKTSDQDLDNCKTSLQDAQNTIQNYETMVQNIGEHLRSCKNELEHTRQKAHHMIMQQGAQISSASVALQDLTNRFIQSFPEIEIDSNMGPQETEHPSSQITEETGKGNIQSSSLVFSILNSPLAADRQDLCSKGNAVNESSVSSHTGDSSSLNEYSTSQLQERNLIGQSANSAFSRVHPTSCSVKEADLSIGEHVQRVNDLFNLLTEKIFHKMQKSNEKIQDLEARSDQLVKDLQKSKKQYEGYILQLQGQLQESEMQVRHLRQELQVAFSRTYDNQEKLNLALREAQTAEMCSSQNTEQKMTILRLQKEIEKLVKELKLSEHNRQMYQEQLTSLTNLISNKGSPDAKQTMGLLSKISAENSKLKKEMSIVEENWQKAETEVKSLDSLFNHCAKLLEKVPQQITNSDRNLQTLSGILVSP